MKPLSNTHYDIEYNNTTIHQRALDITPFQDRRVDKILYWMKTTTLRPNDTSYTGAKECLQLDEIAYAGSVLLSRMQNAVLEHI